MLKECNLVSVQDGVQPWAAFEACCVVAKTVMTGLLSWSRAWSDYNSESSTKRLKKKAKAAQKMMM